MKARHAPLQFGRLEFDERGNPASSDYGDVYHSPAGALAQAQHVFIGGNGLPERWAGRHTFTVAETGFGLGNNFLALWRAWRESAQRPQRLHVLSFEAHPLRRDDLAAALSGHKGDMRFLADSLIRAWPPLLPGLHRLEFEGGCVTLTLALGHVQHLARQVEAGVDAFFLDGFSPARNPAMWSRELFGQLTRIANRGATAATWCSAGQVRRDLAAAGFVVSRVPGFGGKWEISTAVLRPGLGRELPELRKEPVLVVGGSLAGAGVAHSLALRGHAVTVLDPVLGKGKGGSHTGHRAAAMTPTLSRDDNPMSRLSRAGILLAQLRWRELGEIRRRCGSLLRIAAADAEAWRKSLAEWRFPPEWASWCDAVDTRDRCGLPLSEGGVWLEGGTLVRPDALVSTLLAHGNVDVRTASVAGLRQSEDGWQALGADGAVLASAPRVVLATAADTLALLSGALPHMRHAKLASMQRMGGQLGYFRSGVLPQTHAIIAGAGYWLPADEGVHVGGSTYEFDSVDVTPSPYGFQEVIQKIAGLLEVSPDMLAAAGAVPNGWAGRRVAVSDHLPEIGPVDEQETLWLACAYGSRGLSWMTLAGEIMAARLNGEPQVVERELLNAIKPR